MLRKAIFTCEGMGKTLHYRNLFLGVCTGVCVFCFARGYGYIFATGKIMKQMM